MCSAHFELLNFELIQNGQVNIAAGDKSKLNIQKSKFTDGGLAQLARAPALQAGGQRFESVILHLVREK